MKFYTVNQLYLGAIKFGGYATYIIPFNFCPNAENTKFNRTPNLIDLQYYRLTAPKVIIVQVHKYLYYYQVLMLLWDTRILTT